MSVTDRWTDRLCHNKCRTHQTSASWKGVCAHSGRCMVATLTEQSIHSVNLWLRIVRQMMRSLMNAHLPSIDSFVTVDAFEGRKDD